MKGLKQCCSMLQVIMSQATPYPLTLDKPYHFFQDGHIQKIKYHPLPQVSDHSCVLAAVLPSMKKDRVYKVIIFL